MRTKLLALVIALQCAWILGMSLTQERALNARQSVLLETQPVDPRDLLRGDYITLRYKISDVPYSKFAPAGANDLTPGTIVYVALAASTNQFYTITTASLTPFTPKKGEVMLKGACRPGWTATQEPAVRVEYGLEAYYVPEGMGNPRGTLTVEAAVGDGGRARIKNVFLDGAPYLEAMKKQTRARQ